MAMGQNPVPPVNIPIPTKIKPKMGSAPTPKWDPIGLTYSHAKKGGAPAGHATRSIPELPKPRASPHLEWAKQAEKEKAESGSEGFENGLSLGLLFNKEGGVGVGNPKSTTPGKARHNFETVVFVCVCVCVWVCSCVCVCGCVFSRFPFQGWLKGNRKEHPISEYFDTAPHMSANTIIFGTGGKPGFISRWEK